MNTFIKIAIMKALQRSYFQKLNPLLCNHTRNCHLDRNCYGAMDATFYPTGCDSIKFPHAGTTNCLISKPLVIVGDSRTYELMRGLGHLIKSDQMYAS